jgi:hypothetical protein
MRNNYYRNGGNAPNYFPDSFDSSAKAETVKDESYKIKDA